MTHGIIRRSPSLAWQAERMSYQLKLQTRIARWLATEERNLNWPARLVARQRIQQSAKRHCQSRFKCRAAQFVSKSM